MASLCAIKMCSVKWWQIALNEIVHFRPCPPYYCEMAFVASTKKKSNLMQM